MNEKNANEHRFSTEKDEYEKNTFLLYLCRLDMRIVEIFCANVFFSQNNIIFKKNCVIL